MKRSQLTSRLSLGVLLVAAAGCGQTGPLMLPEPGPADSSSPLPPADAADAAEAEEDRSEQDER